MPIVSSSSNYENSRSRHRGGPATANVRARIVPRNKNFSGLPFARDQSSYKDRRGSQFCERGKQVSGRSRRVCPSVALGVAVDFTFLLPSILPSPLPPNFQPPTSSRL